MQHMTTMQESNLWNYSTDQEKTMCGCASALFYLNSKKQQILTFVKLNLVNVFAFLLDK